MTTNSLTRSRPGLRWRGIVLALAAGAALGGCATATNPKDPFEKFNRSMFAFNDAVDRVALKPAATAYKKVLPGFVQTGVNNFFGNLTDAWSAVNNLLQGNGAAGMSDLTRFTFNSTFGLAGVLDIASEAGLQKHNEDLGQTLGTYGIAPGPYLMLPLLGPSTVRDTAALPVDLWADPWSHKDPVNWRNVGIAVRAVDQRASVLDASNLMEEAALDRYEFIRDGFLQRRESRINDGESSRKKDKADDKAAPAADDGGKAATPAGTPAAAPASPAVPQPVSTEPVTK
jgi:phospholipid-binding lipoprotein MlaA